MAALVSGYYRSAKNQIQSVVSRMDTTTLSGTAPEE